MQTVNIHEAKTHLSRLVNQAAAGEEILIARAGKPIARLVGLTEAGTQPRTLGLAKGKFTLPNDFSSLHDETIQRMFEGEAWVWRGKSGCWIPMCCWLR